MNNQDHQAPSAVDYSCLFLLVIILGGIGILVVWSLAVGWILSNLVSLKFFEAALLVMIATSVFVPLALRLLASDDALPIDDGPGTV